jgi:outer membrane protein OmpA-like peptidoglycan-associated protein
MRQKSKLAGLSLALSVWSAGALAQDAEGSISASTDNGVETEGSSSGRETEAESNASDGFWRRYRPTMPALELGIYGGAAWLPKNHNLQSLNVVSERDNHQALKNGGELGLRLAFYPLSFLGAEAEGGLIFSKTGGGDDAKIWVVRGHGILQLPLGRLVPFVLGGGGMLALKTDNSIGDDHDPYVYFGGGLKFAFNQRLSIRLDVRDNFLQKNKMIAGVKDGDTLQQLEVLAGLSVTWGRTPWSDKPADQDADGIYDRDDQCPADAGPAPTGCPPPPDGDRDGVPDSSDPCPTEAEDGNPPDEKDGCPNKDLDNDGIVIPVDLCPDQAGIAPDGCPPKDTDGDGFMDPDDRCPKDAETKNNFEDTDGCPDEVPEEVKKFTGVIKGIQFDSGKATIRASSFPLLDDAVGVLKQYPTLRMRVSGHTDNKGKAAKNQTLSEERAAAVKTYLTSKGVEDSRIETRGVGPDEPIADNKTNAGRAQNRRIEFELLPQ